MKKKIMWGLVLAVLLIVAGGLLLKDNIAGVSAADTDDGRWYDCLPKQCRLYVGFSPLSPSLSAEEKVFMRKIDEIPRPPAKTTLAELTALFGRAPDNVVDWGQPLGRFQWTGFGPGTEGQRGVVVYVHYGQARNIKWYSPNRYMLTKDFELEEDRQAEARFRARQKEEKRAKTQ